jgi:hypothetical protein
MKGTLVCWEEKQDKIIHSEFDFTVLEIIFLLIMKVKFYLARSFYALWRILMELGIRCIFSIKIDSRDKA